MKNTDYLTARILDLETRVQSLEADRPVRFTTSDQQPYDPEELRAFCDTKAQVDPDAVAPGRNPEKIRLSNIPAGWRCATDEEIRTLPTAHVFEGSLEYTENSIHVLSVRGDSALHSWTYLIQDDRVASYDPPLTREDFALLLEERDRAFDGRDEARALNVSLQNEVQQLRERVTCRDNRIASLERRNELLRKQVNSLLNRK
jgi:hypothetical protein